MSEGLNADDVSDTIECSEKIQKYLIKLSERYGKDCVLSCALFSVNAAAYVFYKENFMNVAMTCMQHAMHKVTQERIEEEENE